MKTLDWEVTELKKLIKIERDKGSNKYRYFDSQWEISEYTMGHLDALTKVSDDSLSRESLYYLAGLFGYVPVVNNFG